MTTPRLRLFAGIELDSDARGACASVSAHLKQAALSGRFEPADKLHITLAFLGSTPAQLVGDVQSIITRVCSDNHAFTLHLDRIGAFPHERRPRVIFLGCRNEAQAFCNLTTDLRRALATLGFSFQQSAVAHVTLARVNAGAVRIPSVQFASIGIRVTSVALFASIPDKSTTRYDVLSRAALV